MNISRVTGCAAGTIDFHYDREDDIVFARPRWSLETRLDAMRWYELHATYLRGRFSRPKDLIMVQDQFEVSLEVLALWQGYWSRLHETLVRFSAIATTKPRSRPVAAGSGIRPIEAKTIVDAIEAVVASRNAMPGKVPACA